MNQIRAEAHLHKTGRLPGSTVGVARDQGVQVAHAIEILECEIRSGKGERGERATGGASGRGRGREKRSARVGVALWVKDKDSVGRGVVIVMSLRL